MYNIIATCLNVSVFSVNEVCSLTCSKNVLVNLFNTRVLSILHIIARVS